MRWLALVLLVLSFACAPSQEGPPLSGQPEWWYRGQTCYPLCEVEERFPYPEKAQTAPKTVDLEDEAEEETAPNPEAGKMGDPELPMQP